MKKILFALLIPALLMGQALSTQSLTFTWPLNLPQIGMSAGQVGAVGAVPLYYWIVVRFPGGAIAGAGGPVTAQNTVGVAALAPGTPVVVNWSPVVGATGYDVIRQAAGGTFQSTGACVNCVVALNTALLTVSDQNPVGPGGNWPPAGLVTLRSHALTMALDGVSEVPPYMAVVLDGVPGRLIFSLSWVTPLVGVLSLTAPPGGSTGININAPVTQAIPLIDMHADTNAEFRIGAHGAGVSVLETVRVSRGTFAAPLIVNNGDRLGGIVFEGYSGAVNAYLPAASITAAIDAAPGAAAMPGRLIFSTTLGGAAVVTERLRIAETGYITATSARVAVTNNDASEIQIAVHNANPPTTATWRTDRSRGTLAAQVLVADGDTVGTMLFEGYDGAVYRPLASISAFVDNVAAANDMPGRLVFSTTLDGAWAAPVERLRIDNAGVITATTAQFLVNNSAASEIQLAVHDANPVIAGIQILRKSRGVIGAPVVVVAGDTLGSIVFQGNQTTGAAVYSPAASIVSAVDGAVTSGGADMPGNLIFSTTPDAAAVVVERLRISNTGFIAANSTDFSVNSDGASEIRLAVHGAGVVGTYRGQVSRNTAAAPQIVVAGDTISTLVFDAYDGAAYRPAASITAGVEAAPLTVGAGDMPGNIVFSTTLDATVTPVEHLRINNAGVITATTAQLGITADAASEFQLAVHNNGAAIAGTAIIRKSRGTLAAETIVVNGDTLGSIVFQGNNGVAATYLPAASIVAGVDAAVAGVADMPGNLVFSTTLDGAVAVTERLRIANTGTITATSAQTIQVQDAAADSRMMVHNAGAAVYGTRTFRRSQGTAAAPTIVAVNDTVGGIVFEGANNNAAPTYLPAASIIAEIDAAVAGGGAADMPGRLIFSTTPDAAGAVVERLRIDNAGYITATTAQALVQANAASELQLAVHSVAAATTSPTHRIRRSRGVIGTPLIINNADTIGSVIFEGYDGAAYQPTASIVSGVDAAPGANDMPGNLVFSTTLDAALAVTERLRISNAGVFSFNTNQLVVSATGVATTYAALATAGMGLPPVLVTYSALNQAAAIAAGNLLAAAPAGQYRTSAYLHTTIAEGGACTATVILGWTYNGGAKTKNLVAAHDLNVDEGASDNLTAINVDAGTNITREVTRAGACATGTSRYDLYVTLERLL